MQCSEPSKQGSGNLKIVKKLIYLFAVWWVFLPTASFSEECYTFYKTDSLPTEGFDIPKAELSRISEEYKHGCDEPDKVFVSKISENEYAFIGSHFYSCGFDSCTAHIFEKTGNIMVRKSILPDLECEGLACKSDEKSTSCCKVYNRPPSCFDEPGGECEQALRAAIKRVISENKD